MQALLAYRNHSQKGYHDHQSDMSALGKDGAGRGCCRHDKPDGKGCHHENRQEMGLEIEGRVKHCAHQPGGGAHLQTTLERRRILPSLG